jgi:antitoxin component YwqK of YwqJK toxin-antitoxin module
MRKLLVLVPILTFYFCRGQVIRFQINRITQCDKSGKIDSSYYYLTDDKDSIYNNESGTVFLPKTGKYIIHNWSEPDTDFPTIDINEEGLLIYTHYEPKIVMRSYGMHPRHVYEICGKAIDGFQDDFYPNGNLRIRGNFVKGKPKDSLVTFYANGVTKRRLTYLPKEVLIEEYDSLSNLEKVSHNSNRSYYLTDYKTTEYYPDGKIRLKESNIDRLVKIEAYYPNGQVKIVQTKKGRTEYHENGEKNIVYTWKRKKQKVIPGEYNFDYTITKKIFDETGLPLEVQVYDYWGLYQPQPRLEFSKSDWINRWVKWDNGKEIIVASDVDTEKYFKNNPQ